MLKKFLKGLVLFLALFGLSFYLATPVYAAGSGVYQDTQRTFKEFQKALLQNPNQENLEALQALLAHPMPWNCTSDQTLNLHAQAAERLRTLLTETSIRKDYFTTQEPRAEHSLKQAQSAGGLSTIVQTAIDFRFTPSGEKAFHSLFHALIDRAEFLTASFFMDGWIEDQNRVDLCTKEKLPLALMGYLSHQESGRWKSAENLRARLENCKTQIRISGESTSIKNWLDQNQKDPNHALDTETLFLLEWLKPDSESKDLLKLAATYAPQPEIESWFLNLLEISDLRGIEHHRLQPFPSFCEYWEPITYIQSLTEIQTQGHHFLKVNRKKILDSIFETLEKNQEHGLNLLEKAFFSFERSEVFYEYTPQQLEIVAKLLASDTDTANRIRELVRHPALALSLKKAGVSDELKNQILKSFLHWEELVYYQTQYILESQKDFLLNHCKEIEEILLSHADVFNGTRFAWPWRTLASCPNPPQELIDYAKENLSISEIAIFYGTTSPEAAKELFEFAQTSTISSVLFSIAVIKPKIIPIESIKEELKSLTKPSLDHREREYGGILLNLLRSMEKEAIGALDVVLPLLDTPLSGHALQTIKAMGPEAFQKATPILLSHLFKKEKREMAFAVLKEPWVAPFRKRYDNKPKKIAHLLSKALEGEQINEQVITLLFQSPYSWTEKDREHLKNLTEKTKNLRRDKTPPEALRLLQIWALFQKEQRQIFE